MFASVYPSENDEKYSGVSTAARKMYDENEESKEDPP